MSAEESGMSSSEVYGGGSNIDANSILDKKISRRGLLAVGVAAAAAAAAGGYKLGSGESTKNPQAEEEQSLALASEPTSTPEDIIAEPTEVQDVSLTRNPDFNASHADQDPEKYREVAESSPRELEGDFCLSSKTVSPDQYPEEFTKLFGTALNLGCTMEDIEPYLLLGKDPATQSAAEQSYLEAMDDKYTYPVFRGLFRRMDRSKAEQNPTYQLFKQARHDIGIRFLRNARKTGNVNEFTVVSITSHNAPSIKNDGMGSYAVELHLTIGNDVEEGDVTRSTYEAQGTIRAGVTHELGNRLSTILVHYDPYIGLFEELSEKTRQ